MTDFASHGQTKTEPAERGYMVRQLAAAEFSRWEALVLQSRQGTLFHSQLWLDAVAEPYKLFGCFRGDELRGGFAAGVTGPHGNRAYHPGLTPYLGVIFPRPNGKYVTKISAEKEVAAAFATFLKREFNWVEFRFPPEVNDLQPFMWEGFQAGLRYTYRLSLSNLDAVLTNMDSTRRRNLNKAERLGIVVERDIAFERVLRLCELTFQRQKQKVTFRPVAERVEKAMRSFGRCTGFLARGYNGLEQGAVWIVWDEKRAYYLLGGYDEAAGSSNAVALALWHAIQYVALDLKLPEFDFEGSMIAPIERFFRKFGGTLMPTFTIKTHKPISFAQRVTQKAVRLINYLD